MYHEIRFGYRIADAFFRHRRTFFVALFAVWILPLVVMQTRKKTYTASAATQVITEDMTAILGETARNYSWVSPAQQNMNRFNDDLADDRPDGFLDRTLKEAHLRNVIHVDPKFKDQRFDMLKKGISITLTSDTVFTIGLVWDDQNECEQITRALQHQYIEQIGKNRQTESVNATNFLDDQIANYAKRMRTSEQALILYQQTHSGQSEAASADDQNQLSMLKTQLDDLQIQEHSASLRRRGIQERLDGIRRAAKLAPYTIDNQEDPQLNVLEEKRRTLLAEGWLPTSERVQAIDAQISSLKQEAAQAYRNKLKERRDPVAEALKHDPAYQDLLQQLTAIDIDGKAHQAQLQLLQQKINAYQIRIKKNPSAAQELNDRTRDYTSLKTQYDELVKRREQMQMKANLDKISASSTLRPLGVIYAQPTTSKAKTLMMAGVLFLIGLAVGVLLIIVGERGDLSLRYESDVVRALGTSVLAVIPEVRDLNYAPNPPDGVLTPGTRRVRGEFKPQFVSTVQLSAADETRSGR